MTEEEWLGCSDPQPMLEFLRRSMPSRNSESRRLGETYLNSDYYLPDLGRKIGMFICACVSRRPTKRDVEETLLFKEFERYCDGLAVWAEVEKSYWNWIKREEQRIAEKDRRNNSVTSVQWILPSGYFADPSIIRESAKKAAGKNDGRLATEQRIQCEFLRDIFGNPFRPVLSNLKWLSSNVTAIATGIYEERAFDRMPVLGDALEDAGCSSQDILNHLRQPGEHVKGCWALDVVLGKE